MVNSELDTEQKQVSTNTQSLPSYSNPPIVETAISVQFAPIRGFKNVHLWEFWSSIQDDYPETRDQEPLEQRTELFGDSIIRGPIPSRRIVIRPHASRLQAMSSDSHRMIQIQNGRLIFNWRRLSGGEYPRWSDTYAEFERNYHRFCEYVEKADMAKVAPNQWEVVYVNHILLSEAQLNTPWREILPGMLGETNRVSAGQFETADCNIQYLLPDCQGRLYAELKHAYSASSPEVELLTLTLTARGELSDSCDVGEGLSIGHRAIVTAFSELASESLQRSWGRK